MKSKKLVYTRQQGQSRFLTLKWIYFALGDSIYLFGVTTFFHCCAPEGIPENSYAFVFTLDFSFSSLEVLWFTSQVIHEGMKEDCIIREKCGKLSMITDNAYW